MSVCVFVGVKDSILRHFVRRKLGWDLVLMKVIESGSLGYGFDIYSIKLVFLRLFSFSTYVAFLCIRVYRFFSMFSLFSSNCSRGFFF